MSSISLELRKQNGVGGEPLPVLTGTITYMTLVCVKAQNKINIMSFTSNNIFANAISALM